MLCRPTPKRSLVRVIAIALAFLFVVFGSQAASHFHNNAQDEASCRHLRKRHTSALLQHPPLLLFTPILASGYVQPFVLKVLSRAFFYDSPPWSPPIRVIQKYSYPICFAVGANPIGGTAQSPYFQVTIPLTNKHRPT